MKLLRNFMISCVLAVTIMAGVHIRDVKAQAFAEIGTGYIVTNYFSLVTTYLLSLPADERPPRSVDGYARIFACPLLKEYYTNEFEWRKVRENLNMAINRLDREYFSYYEFSGSAELDSYDFEKEVFPLSKKTAITGIRLLNIFRYGSESQRSERLCSSSFDGYKKFIADFLPVSFSVRLPSSISLKEISLAPKEAERFVNTSKLDSFDNTRRVYLRFRVRLDAIADTRIAGSATEIVFNGELLGLDVFADKELTQHLANVEI